MPQMSKCILVAAHLQRKPCTHFSSKSLISFSVQPSCGPTWSHPTCSHPTISGAGVDGGLRNLDFQWHGRATWLAAIMPIFLFKLGLGQKCRCPAMHPHHPDSTRRKPADAWQCARGWLIRHHWLKAGSSFASCFPTAVWNPNWTSQILRTQQAHGMNMFNDSDCLGYLFWDPVSLMVEVIFFWIEATLMKLAVEFVIKLR